MRVSKFENRAIPAPVRAYQASPYQSHHIDDTDWVPPVRAYGAPAEDPRHARLLAYAQIAGRLAVPVLLLATLMQALYLYADAPLPISWLPGFAEGQLLIFSDLLLPGCWMMIHLTNRRFGPAYAFGHLVAGMALALLLVLVDPWSIRASLPDLAVLSGRAVAAFLLVFAIANFTGIVFFDAARGRRWWTAPLLGAIAASFVFSGLYYPLAFGRLGLEALVHFALFLGLSLALMGPYFLLRPAMKPISGMNGY